MMKPNEKPDLAILISQDPQPGFYWAKRGFGLRVYPGGKKAFVLAYRAAGRKRLLTLGNLPDITLEKAEDLAAAYRLQIGEGIDPVMEKRLATCTGQPLPLQRFTHSRSVQSNPPQSTATFSTISGAFRTIHPTNSGRRNTQRRRRFSYGKAPSTFRLITPTTRDISRLMLSHTR
jgi:hypothetical protein